MTSFRNLICAFALAGFASLQAAMILPTGNVECFDCNPALIGVQQLPTVNNIAGIKIFTLSPITITPEDFDGEMSALLDISTLGNISDIPPVSGLQIPFSYSMTLSTTGTAQIVDWLLTAGIGAENDDEDGILGLFFAAGEGGGAISGSGMITFIGTEGFTAGFGGVLLSLEVNVIGNGNVILDSPHSFNVGAATPNAVPEPATVGSGAAGLLLLLAARRRRRN